MKNEHIIMDMLYQFEEKKRNIIPSNYIYDFKKGVWVNGTSNEQYLMSIDNPDKLSVGTKKCDQETGEDQKGE